MAVEYSGGKPPLTQAELEAIRAQHEEASRAAAPPRTMIEPGDLTDRETVAGRSCRPFSAGLYAILEMVDSPVLREEEPPFADMVVILYLLMAEEVSEEELTALASAGYDTLRQAAVAWAFKLPMEEIQPMVEEVTARFNKLAATAEIYAAAEKKTAGSPVTGSSTTATS